MATKTSLNYMLVLMACLFISYLFLMGYYQLDGNSFIPEEQRKAQCEDFKVAPESHKNVSETKQDERVDDEEIEAEFAKRRELYMTACADMKATSVGFVMTHISTKLAVCHTPKVGCTFWKRIMTFLSSENKKWKSPLDIDRYTVHNSIPNFEHPLSKTKDNISTFDRVLYARDPYRRLWSVYIDKIILPDSWKDFGLSINKHFNLGQEECPLTIGFEHFLRFAIYKHRNSHWTPIKTVCDPCSFHPQYIGKMETFSRDTAYILRKRGLDHSLKSNTGRDHVEDELIILIDYHFKIHYARSINHKCLNETTLAERLWRAFQLNGYFALDDPFPEDLVKKSGKCRNASEMVKKVFVDHYKQNKRTKSQIKNQREQVLKDTYSTIPLDLKNDIRKFYDADFKLFGYDPKPSIVFSKS